MIKKLSNWFHGEDVKALYRLNKLTLTASENTITNRQLLTYAVIFIIFSTITMILTGDPQ